MNKDKSGSLEELLLFDNFQILGTPFRFAEVIYKREGIPWNEAQRKASGLIKANAGWNYLEDLRQRMNIDSHSLTTNTPQQFEIVSAEAEHTAITEQPAETPKQDMNMFEENYLLLTRFAPELEEELQALTDKGILSGKSVANLHGSASIQSIEKDKYGYYLLLQINESTKPEQRIWLFVNTAVKTVQVLSCEINGEKFEVYNDIHTREMVNPQQLELQNKHLNKHLNRLIDFKLTIPTIGIVPIEEPATRTVQESRSNYPVYKDPISDAVKAHFHEITAKTNLFDKYEDDVDDEPDIDDLQEEIRELEEHVQFLEKDVYRTHYRQNFRLLKMLVPGLADELNLRSFKVTLHPEAPEYPVFEFDFETVQAHEIMCAVYELHPISGKREYKCCLNLLYQKELVFVDSPGDFFGLEEEIIIADHEQVSKESLHANSVVFTFFLTLMSYKYRATISDRIYPVQVVKATSKVEEIETLEAVEESQESDGTGTVAAVLATIGLGILGFKFLKP